MKTYLPVENPKDWITCFNRKNCPAECCTVWELTGHRPSDCPLVQMPTREEASKLIIEYASTYEANNTNYMELLDNLGFKKEKP